MKKTFLTLLDLLKLRQPAFRLKYIIINIGKSISRHIRERINYRSVKKAKKTGVLAVDICNGQGLGAKLEHSLEIMAYCDEVGLTPRFRFSYPDSEDYFSKFFFMKEEIKTEKKVTFIRIEFISDLGLKKNYDKALTIDYAGKLISKHLGIKEDIIREVDRFVADHFKEKSVLGVHYRSTDKIEEAPFVPHNVVKENMDLYIHHNPSIDAVFISTDDNHFRKYIYQAFKTRPLIFREDYFRSNDHSSVHHNVNLDKYEVNRDALVNCLLLSKCHALIKTCSLLSDWSKLFNPSIPVKMLNRPYKDKLWFPASQLIQEAG